MSKYSREYISFGANNSTKVEVSKHTMYASELCVSQRTIYGIYSAIDSINEKKAHQILTGGYNQRNVMCKECFTKKSVTGHCLCDE